MKKILMMFAFVAIAAAVFAVPLTASWVEGKVEHGNGKTWKLLNIGDKIDSAESVRLAPGAMVEFTEGSRRIALSAPGTFVLENLRKAGGEQAKNRSAAMGKLGKLVDPKAAESATAVAGVRGDAQVEAETMWAAEEDGASALAEEARAYARESRFADAAGLFAQAAAASTGDEKDGYLYSRAWSLAAGGATIEALKALRSFVPATAAWSVQRDLLLARLDIDSGSTAEAKTLLNKLVAAGGLSPEDLELAKGMLAEAK